MRHKDEKQRQFQQQKNRPKVGALDAKSVVAVCPSPSPSFPLSLHSHCSPTVFGPFNKTTTKLDQSKNEQLLNQSSRSPVVDKVGFALPFVFCLKLNPKEHDLISPNNSLPTFVGAPRLTLVPFANKAVPSSSSAPSRHPDIFDLPSPSSPSFVPSSPMPSSPNWHQMAQCSNAGTVPKSAMLLSKCQSFLKNSSLPIPPAAVPSSAIAKHKMGKDCTMNQQNPTEQKAKKEDKNKLENMGEGEEEEKEENIFNFEGLFEVIGNSEETLGDNGATTETDGEKTNGRPERAVETVVCSLTLARKNEAMSSKCDWPYPLNECCYFRICQQKERTNVEEGEQNGEGTKEDGAKPKQKEEERAREEEQPQRAGEDANEQSHQPRSARRATRPHQRRGRPPPLPPITPATSALSVIPFLGPSGECSLSPSTSTTSPPIPSNVIYSIRIGGIQLRNVPASSPSSREKDLQLVVAIRMDRKEVFRSCPVHLHRNSCVISEEFCMELPRSSIFQSLQLSLFELSEGARIQRCIGRLRLTRHELVAYGNAIQDRWLPIARIRPSELTETLGAICAEMNWNVQRKVLTLSVFDFTIWTFPTNNGRVNPLQRHCNDSGRFYLKCRLGFGPSAFSTTQKMRLVERRSVEPVRFDCSHFFADKSAQRHRPPEGSSPHSLDEWANCRSPCDTPTSAFSARFNSRHFKFPPPRSPALFYQQQNKGPKAQKGPMLCGETHLYIKLYGKPNYSEESFCGFVHIPLETETMKPRETPHGPNWFNILSRAETTIITQLPSFVTNNTAFCSSISTQLTTSELNSAPPSPFQQKQSEVRQKNYPCSSDFPHNRRVSVVPSNSSPSFHRHCSPGSTSASSASSFTKSGSASHTTVATRLKSLTAPSFPPLFSSGATEPSNDCFTYTRKNNQQKHQRHLLANQSSSSTSNNQQNSGEVRLRLRYDMDEMHPFTNYRPLYLNLVRSLNVDPHACSLISLIQCLPIDLENLAKPLMKIFVHSNQIRQFFRAICMDYVKSCNDVNTLFRSQSLASKVMYEMMKFVGHNYLFNSLKPLIDLIFAERKCCEIDPSKLKPGDSLEQNFRSITTYAELAFDQVVNSLPHCPKALRVLFAELRGVVEQIYPNRQDVARLAVSSFLIMRFFAAAILNPKLFALKLETPDVEVSRTLVLVSKVLQRISNCVVSAHPLTNKEQWLTSVLQRFSDRDKIAMIQFLDKISENDSEDICQPSEMNFVNNENISPVSNSFCETTILKSGYLIERRCSPVKKRSFKNLIHPKRRFVFLTDVALIWLKSAKDGTTSTTSSLMSNSLTMSNDFNTGAEQQKSRIVLSDVTSVSVLSDAKNAFKVSTMNTEVHFQTNNEAELNEWIILIQKQQRRQLMLKNRFVLNSQVQQQICAEIDLERELHVVYTNLASHMDTLCDHNWCCRFECARCDGGKYNPEGCTISGTEHPGL